MPSSNITRTRQRKNRDLRDAIWRSKRLDLRIVVDEKK